MKIICNTLLFFFVFINNLSNATPPHSTVVTHRANLKTFCSKFNFGLPILFVDYCVPLKSKANTHFPEGMDKYFATAKPDGAATLPFIGNNYSIRLIALYYKDKPGIELYWSGFGGNINMDDYLEFLKNKFPNHYISNSNYINNSYGFDGAGIGVTYKQHIRNFVIEPKFIFGFEKQSFFSNSNTFKEIGSNQFTQYSIERHINNSIQHSFHFQLHLAKRFVLFKNNPKPATLEAGIKAEYLYAPYTLNVKIIEQTYGKPAVINEFTSKTNFSLFSIGAFVTMYWFRKK